MLIFSGIGCISCIDEETDVEPVESVVYIYERDENGVIERPAELSDDEMRRFILPDKTIDDYEYIGIEIPKEGDFIVTTDEFYEKHGKRFFGHLSAFYSDNYASCFEVYEYNVVNITEEDNNVKLRKLLYEEFKIEENLDYNMELIKLLSEEFEPNNKMEIRKLLLEEFEPYKNIEDLIFIIKDKTVIEGRTFRELSYYTDEYFDGTGDKKLKYDYYVYNYAFYRWDDSYESFGGYNLEPFRIENETEFMNKYEVVEYDKIWG